MTKPKLVDYSLFKKSFKKINKNNIIIKKDNSLLINIISILILFIGGLILYYRFQIKDQNDIMNQNKIIELYEYVNGNIK